MSGPDDFIDEVSSWELFQLTSRDEEIRGEDQRQFGLDDGERWAVPDFVIYSLPCLRIVWKTDFVPNRFLQS